MVCMLVNQLRSELLTVTINPAIASGKPEDLGRREKGAKIVTVINQNLNEKAGKGV